MLSGCQNHSDLVQQSYVDSIVKNFNPEKAKAVNTAELNFWKNRIDPNRPGISNELKLAYTFIRRFHLLGDIADLQKAERVLNQIDSLYNHKEASVYLSLTETALLQHQFPKAYERLQKAKQLGLEKYLLHSFTFDVEFELGRNDIATYNLSQMKSPVDYGYHFRRAKLFHLSGQPDSATAYMLKAASLADQNQNLKAIALANAADFELHTGNIKEAVELFQTCLKINPNDMHSLMGLGTIAMRTEQDYGSAEKLFNLAKSNYKLPDPVYKLYQLAQSRKDKAMEKKYASSFAKLASQKAYGKMYTKYLIELYTGVLNNPALAEQIAKEELTNRSTPQTAAWYAWALFCNKKSKEAERVYKQQVSGKPLEGFELYYMGKLMKGINKGYTAESFFKAAEENKFDLSPAMEDDLN